MTRRTPRPRRLTPVIPWPEAGSLEAWIRAERVRLVYQQALPTQLLAIVAGGVICYALWAVGNQQHLLVWLVTVTVVTLARMGLSVWFQRVAPDIMHMKGWEVLFVVTLGLVTLTWGVGGWLIMPADSLLHRGIVYFFLMGVAGGAVASYSAHPAATAVAVVALMLPATVSFAIAPALELRVLAVGGTLYLAAALRSTQNFGFFLRKNFQLSFELHEAYARATELARTDELTGLPNRRAFVEQGATAIELARRHERPLSVVMFDIDNFKKINDEHGHAVGDLVLQEVAAAIWHVARTSDTPGRLGGEEFALLLPETPGTDAVTLAERLRTELATRRIAGGATAVRLTCSFGVAARDAGGADLDTLMREADDALYRAKAAGRDRVVRAP